ncbi:hypothetical protein [Chitinimonas lacunae]|uniref:Uncharacterized protein n=1 Tax=Chitinimonas lacunae TaxID=1963018 RepID=A0ABV8MSB1_9NEIS
MKVKELLPGDQVVDRRRGEEIRFEVVAVDKIGGLFQVTFRSMLGLASACYNGNAYIAAVR